MTRRWGGGSALLLAALLPAACMKTVEFDHPVVGAGGGGGASGSGAGVGGGGGNSSFDGGSGNPDASRLHCSSSATLTPLSPPSLERPAIMFALDRSRSMTTQLGSNNGTRFSVTASAITSEVKAYSTLVSFGYVEFPTGDSSCSGMCCAAGFSPVSTSSSMSTIGEINFWLGQCSMSSQSLTCNTNSDVVPTGQAMRKIANAFQGNTTNTLYALLLTDGTPTSNCQLDPTQMDDACDQTANQIGKMLLGDTFSLPITTLVVGIGSDIPADAMANNCLNKMALAGGHPAPASPFYSLATTDTSLDALVDTFVTNAICTMDIDDPTFDPSHSIEVDFKSAQMSQSDPFNGWTLDLDGRTPRLTFNGSLCMTLIQGLKNASNPSRYVNANVVIKQCVDPSHPFQQPPP